MLSLLVPPLWVAPNIVIIRIIIEIESSSVLAVKTGLWESGVPVETGLWESGVPSLAMGYTMGLKLRLIKIIAE